MRVRCRSSRVVLGNRPFQGSLGASLYVGTTETGIAFRRQRVSTRRSPWWCVSRTMIDPGAATVPKSQRVATVASPATSFTWTLPTALRGIAAWFQARTFAADFENEQVAGARKIVTDSSGNSATPILGTVVITGLKKLDNGGVRISWSWTPNVDGTQPTSFVISKLTGTGTIANVTVGVNGGRTYSANVTGMSDGVAYTFQLAGVNGAVNTVLATGIAWTGVVSGPPEVTGLVCVPVS